MERDDSIIDHYRIGDKIAAGGMGVVFKAIDLDNGRSLAIKVLRGEYRNQPLAIERFIREARNASMLSHPNVCRILDCQDNGELQYIAMEFVDGATLKEHLRKGLLPVATALKYAIDIANALVAAHQLGIVHRDLKPSNVMINNQEDRAVVLDFGLSKKLADPSVAEEETLSYMVVSPWIFGTIDYLSPEQIEHRPLDARADIFSFGILLYEMLTGVKPFSKNDALDTMQAIKQAEPLPPSRLRPDLSLRLDKVIQKVLRKNPDERYGSMAELRAELSALAKKRRYYPRVTAAINLSRHRFNDLVLFFKRWSNVFGFVIIAFAVVVGAREWKRLRQADAAAVAIPHTTPLVNWKLSAAETLTGGRFSPAGDCIAYSLLDGEEKGVWVKCRDSAARRITDSANAWSPLWSPDGSAIAYISKAGNEISIWSVPAAGGSSAPLFRIPDSKIQLPFLISWRSSAIYYESDSNLWRFDLTARQSSRITSFQPVRGFPRSFNVAHNEQRIAFVDDKSGVSKIYVAALDGRDPVRITDGADTDSQPLWSAHGNDIVYSSNRQGRYQIRVATTTGNGSYQLTAGDADSHAMDISADGTKILAFSNVPEADIWAYNIDTKTEIEVAADKDLELNPQPSPDGQSLVYQLDISYPRLTTDRIVTKPTSGTGQVAEITSNGFYPLWSPDGKALAFLRAGNNHQMNLWVRSDSGESKQITTGGIYFGGVWPLHFAYPLAPAFNWLPSNDALVYSVMERSGLRLFVSYLDGRREEAQVDLPKDVMLGCLLPSPSSNKIAFAIAPLPFSKDNQWSIWVLDLATMQARMIYQTGAPLILNQWLPDDTHLIFSNSRSAIDPAIETEDVDLWRLDITNGARKALAVLPSAYLMEVQVVPGSNQVSYVSRRDGKDNLWLLKPDSKEELRLTANPDPKEYYSGVRWRSDGKIAYWVKQVGRAKYVQIEPQ